MRQRTIINPERLKAIERVYRESQAHCPTHVFMRRRQRLLPSQRRRRRHNPLTVCHMTPNHRITPIWDIVPVQDQAVAAPGVRRHRGRQRREAAAPEAIHKQIRLGHQIARDVGGASGDSEVVAKVLKDLNGAADALARSGVGGRDGIGEAEAEQGDGGVPLPLEGLVPAAQDVRFRERLVHDLRDGHGVGDAGGRVAVRNRRTRGGGGRG